MSSSTAPVVDISLSALEHMYACFYEVFLQAQPPLTQALRLLVQHVFQPMPPRTPADEVFDRLDAKMQEHFEPSGNWDIFSVFYVLQQIRPKFLEACNIVDYNEIVDLNAKITDNHAAIQAKDAELLLLRADVARFTAASAARGPGPSPPAARADAGASAESFFQEGNRLYSQQRYFDAAQSWGHATVLNHATSHAFLSDMLFHGRPAVPKNMQRSFQLAKAGAALDCIHSKAILGHFYIAGQFVARNEKKGKALIIKSSQAGSRFGQYHAGICLLAINHLDSAVLMFRLAAEQGHAAAQVKLGEMYEAGRGCVQVYALALEQFRLAAQQGLASAHVNMGSMFEEGRGVAQDYSEAARLYRLAAEQGYLGGQCMLGIMFLNGVGGVQREEAVQLLTLAAAQTSDNDARYAQIVLEMCLRD